jgi:hypothetical protein
MSRLNPKSVIGHSFLNFHFLTKVEPVMLTNIYRLENAGQPASASGALEEGLQLCLYVVRLFSSHFILPGGYCSYYP